MLNQKLQQKQLQKLSPQQIHLMKLLQMPVMALEQRINKEIEENPVLEDLDDRVTTDEFDNMNTNDTDYSNDSSDNSGESLQESENELNTTNEVDSDNEFSLEDYMSDDDDIPAYKLYANNTSRDDERKEIPFASGMSFIEYLLDQVNTLDLTYTQKIIAKQIIGSLDESGYLKRELLSISDDLSFNENMEVTEEEIEKVLQEVQKLDPAGIAGRDLKECLSIQLRRMGNKEEVKAAGKIIDFCLEDLTQRHYNKIREKLKLTEDEMKSALQIIHHLNPKPGGSVSETELNANYIYPDFVVTIVGGEPVLSLTSPNAPELRIKNSYRNLMNIYSKSSVKSQQDAAEYIKQKIDSAKLFIDSIQQRQKTLYNTMMAIINRQKDFFLTGEEIKLKPLILKDISQDINMDISTVSRVVNSKYVVTPYGTYLLKFFFSESMSTDSGEEVSNREIKIILRDCIANEDKKKPLTDDELMKILNEKGYNIARRTIAKYRQQLSIPVARYRKQM